MKKNRRYDQGRENLLSTFTEHAYPRNKIGPSIQLSFEGRREKMSTLLRKSEEKRTNANETSLLALEFVLIAAQNDPVL